MFKKKWVVWSFFVQIVLAVANIVFVFYKIYGYAFISTMTTLVWTIELSIVFLIIYFSLLKKSGELVTILKMLATLGFHILDPIFNG